MFGDMYAADCDGLGGVCEDDDGTCGGGAYAGVVTCVTCCSASAMSGGFTCGTNEGAASVADGGGAFDLGAAT